MKLNAMLENSKKTVLLNIQDGFLIKYFCITFIMMFAVFFFPFNGTCGESAQRYIENSVKIGAEIVVENDESMETNILSYRQIKQGFTLDPNIEKKILAPGRVKKITSITMLEYFSNNLMNINANEKNKYDFIDIHLQLWGNFNQEQFYYANLIIRKKVSERNWDNCEIFYSGDKSIKDLAMMEDEEMRKYLYPYGQ